MTYEEQAEAWIQNSPYVEIPVGRFTLKFKIVIDRDWGWSWEFMEWLLPDEYVDSPEDAYFWHTYNEINAHLHDMECVDELIDAMQKKPFKQGETV